MMNRRESRMRFLGWLHPEAASSSIAADRDPADAPRARDLIGARARAYARPRASRQRDLAPERASRAGVAILVARSDTIATRFGSRLGRPDPAGRWRPQTRSHSPRSP